VQGLRGRINRGGADMITGSCHCGAVHIAVCRGADDGDRMQLPRSAVGWGRYGAYYRPDQVTLTHAPGANRRLCLGRQEAWPYAAAQPAAAITHWEPIGSTPVDRMGVHARLLDIDLDDIPVRKFDGASMD